MDYFITAETYDEVKNFIQDQGSDQPVQIVGYSYGGGRALEIANELEEEGMTVDTLITIDPFQRTIGDSDDMSPTEALSYGVNINFYQTDRQFATRSMGQPKGNMLNLNVGAITGESITHRNIIRNEYVKELTKEILKTVYNQKAKSNWNKGGVSSEKKIKEGQAAIINYGSSGFQKLARSRGLM